MSGQVPGRPLTCNTQPFFCSDSSAASQFLQASKRKDGVASNRRPEFFQNSQAPLCSARILLEKQRGGRLAAANGGRSSTRDLGAFMPIQTSFSRTMLLSRPSEGQCHIWSPSAGRFAMFIGTLYDGNGSSPQATMKTSNRRSESVPNTGWNIARIIAASLLLFAAATKCHQCSTGPLPGNGLFSSRWFVMCLVEAEWLGAVVLFSSLLPKQAWAVTLACFSVFTLVSLGKGLLGEASCGCFGHLIEVNPFVTAALDLAIVLSLLRWRPQQSSFSIHKAVTATAIWTLGAILAAFAMASYTPTTLSDNGKVVGNDRVVVLEPEKWLGKQFPLLNYIDIGSQLREGKWIVLLYHHDCPKCLDAIVQFDTQAHRWSMTPTAPRVALLEMPPFGRGTGLPLSANTRCVLGRVCEQKTWFVQSPLVMALEAGYVRPIKVLRQPKPDAVVRIPGAVINEMAKSPTRTVTLQGNADLAGLTNGLQSEQ